ncbi:hypothetical protein ACK2F5_14840 [Clostridioides difficile]
MNKKDTMHLIFTIVIFILLWYIVVTVSEINKNIESCSNKLDYLSQEIMSTKSDISNTINEEMSKSYITKSIDLKVKKSRKKSVLLM